MSRIRYFYKARGFMKIFIHQRSENGVLHQIESFDSPMDFSAKYNEYIIKHQFSENENAMFISWSYRKLFNKENCFSTHEFCKVAKTENDKIIQVSQLIGWARDYSNMLRAENAKKFYHRRQGRKAKAYGNFRYPRTMNEMRQYAAANDDEYHVKVRANRNPKNLPNAWDDYYTSVEKNWKRASNRRHQWA